MIVLTSTLQILHPILQNTLSCHLYVRPKGNNNIKRSHRCNHNQTMKAQIHLIFEQTQNEHKHASENNLKHEEKDQRTCSRA